MLIEIPSPSENCLLVILVGATRWQKEHVEAAALRNLFIWLLRQGLTQV